MNINDDVMIIKTAVGTIRQPDAEKNRSKYLDALVHNEVILDNLTSDVKVAR